MAASESCGRSAQHCRTALGVSIGKGEVPLESEPVDNPSHPFQPCGLRAHFAHAGLGNVSCWSFEKIG